MPIAARIEQDPVVAVAELQRLPNKQNNLAELAGEEEGLEEEEAVGECNSAEVQTGFCSSLAMIC